MVTAAGEGAAANGAGTRVGPRRSDFPGPENEDRRFGRHYRSGHRRTSSTSTASTSFSTTSSAPPYGQFLLADRTMPPPARITGIIPAYAARRPTIGLSPDDPGRRHGQTTIRPPLTILGGPCRPQPTLRCFFFPGASYGPAALSTRCQVPRRSFLRPAANHRPTAATRFAGSARRLAFPPGPGRAHKTTRRQPSRAVWLGTDSPLPGPAANRAGLPAGHPKVRGPPRFASRGLLRVPEPQSRTKMQADYGRSLRARRPFSGRRTRRFPFQPNNSAFRRTAPNAPPPSKARTTRNPLRVNGAALRCPDPCGPCLLGTTSVSRLLQLLQNNAPATPRFPGDGAAEVPGGATIPGPGSVRAPHRFRPGWSVDAPRPRRAGDQFFRRAETAVTSTVTPSVGREPPSPPTAER